MEGLHGVRVEVQKVPNAHVALIPMQIPWLSHLQQPEQGRNQEQELPGLCPAGSSESALPLLGLHSLVPYRVDQFGTLI